MEDDNDYEKLEYEFLDTLDIASMIKEHKDLNDLMQYIETNYNKDYKYETFIFNNIDHLDFLSYLQKRYSLIVYERTKYELKLKEENK